eukprot:1143210-Pelagomonas_calceolata.AAC.2
MHKSRSMPQQCSQGISGSSANHTDADCIYTEPDLFYTAATSQNDTPSILLTHPNNPNNPNTQNGSHNPRKKRKESLHIETELQTPTINPLASNSNGGSIWKNRETSVNKLAQETTASHAINAIHYNDFDITYRCMENLFNEEKGHEQ